MSVIVLILKSQHGSLTVRNYTTFNGCISTCHALLGLIDIAVRLLDIARCRLSTSRIIDAEGDGNGLAVNGMDLRIGPTRHSGIKPVST